MHALIFDLDGTLIDTVYAHVFAWQRAFGEAGIGIDGWRIHRRVGMSGGQFVRAVTREIGRELTTKETEDLQDRHLKIYEEIYPQPRPLPGAIELLRCLKESDVTYGIATSGGRPEIDASLEAIGVGDDVVVIDSSFVAQTKPSPDLFLACQKKLGVSPLECYVVGDAVWDILAARRAGMLSVGLLSGGYGEEELISAGAYRVYRDPAELLTALDELGVLK
ncbi:MAG TPA: HAD family hydrolase [Pyrinomonadaceae bacterium]|nr:HAD family hydrolase [Pyrinomonadaceae bacterium]